MKQLQSNKVGQVSGPLVGLVSAGLVFVILAIILSFGATTVNEVKKTQTVNSTAENISQAGLSSLNKFGDFMPITAVVVIAAAIIALLIGAFAFVRMRG